MTSPFQSAAATLGTPEHAAAVTDLRHPGIRSALAWLCFSHLPKALQEFSRPFYQTAVEILVEIPVDSPELTTALNKLVEAKDWAVRAGIRADQGKPGPAPRPATVTDVPVFPTRPIRDDPQA